MKPEKKMTATMKTIPATMPTQAATAVRRLGRRVSTYAGDAGAAVVTGPVAGSEDDVVSLMNPSMQGMPMYPS
jgi:hypothetical protein